MPVPNALSLGMRLPGRRQECGSLLELGWLSRQLRLSQPVAEATDVIAVAQIIGTVHRGRDFDGCWNPLDPKLAKKISEIESANPVGLDEPIEVIRLDRAYFVVDGHKRVSLARRSGREFLDATIRRLPSPYELSPDVEADTIMRTAREGEFRRHSGMADAVPDARFALTELEDYGELLESVRSHAYALAERNQRFVARAEAAADWHRSIYLPTVAEARGIIGDLLRSCTDADAFLMIHRQRLAFWGTECDSAECAAAQVLTRRRLDARTRTPLSRVRGRAGSRRTEGPLLLPLADLDEDA
jgi:hypothetical protein